MSFSETIRNKAFVACKRSCCICHRFVGIKIEIHHIVHKSEGGEDSFENAIPLCFNCHADMRSYDSKHPKGSKYTRAELIDHRDAWYKRVKSTPAQEIDVDARGLNVAVFDIVREILPWNGSVKIVRQHNFASRFKYEWLEQFNLFLERCSDPSFEFLNADLESLRVELRSSILFFMRLASESCSSVENNDEYSSVPLNWKYHDRELYYKTVDDLQSAGDRVGAAYDNLIQSSRRKLGA